MLGLGSLRCSGQRADVEKVATSEQHEHLIKWIGII